eukprot:CAMPEP_0114579534 /NCGR_PEP_ID=MMETSP0125-20121206/3869_1 /TAXON_ID=485358 ORGANISM="Aristerostoma sp., Strain ATCC 50986" /NCGR_SAMPLE_ID=MMETSP0125 /ASSEMBLY_ACC=CAM_ASM_000245 /LENGTH=252 /DNA_ID=CAMNT_0001770291 /DNA_START=1326 /DNA_END=2085 /DNA_ORIENTATION=-
MEELSKLPNLERVSLDLTDCGKFEKSTGEVMQKNLAKMPKLVEFNISWANCGGIKDDLINKFAFGLSSLVNLQSLYLDLSGLKDLTNNGIKGLSSSIGGLKQQLDFVFLLIIAALRKVKTLKGFTLDMSDCSHLKDDDVFLISEILKKLDVELAYLSLTLSRNKNFTVMALNRLVSSLEALKVLEGLSLDMSSCKQLTTEEVARCFSILKQFKQMKRLRLDFFDCEKVVIKEKDRAILMNDVDFMEEKYLRV